MQSTSAIRSISGAWWSRRQAGWLGAGALLVVAAAVVGLAIVTDGAAARALNGIGAVGWSMAAGLLAWSLRAGHRPLLPAIVALAAAVGLAVVVRPSDLLAAVVGFGAAGALVAVVARVRAVGWALLVPAAYLPVHVVLAVGRSLLAGSTRVRTEPPPTAAVVPLAMVLATAAAAILVTWLRGRVTDAAGPAVADGSAD